MRLFLPFLIAVIACGGTPLAGVPQVICPTPISATQPQPTPVTLPATAAAIGDTITIAGVSFQVTAPTYFPLDDGDRIALWTLVIVNDGLTEYAFLPTVQMTITAIETPDGMLTGTWWSTGESAEVAGVEIERETLFIQPNMTTTARFAAQIPAGNVAQISLTLDANQLNSPVLNWRDQVSGCGAE